MPRAKKKRAHLKLQPNSKVLFIGDSITDAGRSPQGEGLFDALGKGYVAQVDALLGTFYPEHGIRTVNKGTSGNTVRDLKHRWKQDALDVKADWVVIMIGINDVWRQFDSPEMPETHVNIEEYENTLVELVARTQTESQLQGLVLMTPFFIEPNQSDPMRATMDLYGAVVRRVALRFGVVFVDMQAAFDSILQHRHSAALAWDRVHPNATGTMVIARAFLDAIGFEWGR